MLPGVADPAVDLEHGLGDLTGAWGHVRLGDPGRGQCVRRCQPVHRPGGVVGGAAGRFGAHVLIGGQVGIADHVTIGSGAQIMAAWPPSQRLYALLGLADPPP